MSSNSSVSSSLSDLQNDDLSDLVLSASTELPKTLSTKVTKTRCYRYPWTREEDFLLTQYVHKFGEKNWKVISENIPGRTGKQCRQRWLYNLSPDIHKRKWTEEEDKILLSTQKEVGNKWTYIRKLLPGRSENDVKNRFHSIMNRMKTQTKREEVMTKNGVYPLEPSEPSEPLEPLEPLEPYNALHDNQSDKSRDSQGFSSISSSFIFQDSDIAGDYISHFPYDDVIHSVMNCL